MYPRRHRRRFSNQGDSSAGGPGVSIWGPGRAPHADNPKVANICWSLGVPSAQRQRDTPKPTEWPQCGGNQRLSDQSLVMNATMIRDVRRIKKHCPSPPRHGKKPREPPNNRNSGVSHHQSLANRGRSRLDRGPPSETDRGRSRALRC